MRIHTTEELQERKALAHQAPLQSASQKLTETRETEKAGGLDLTLCYLLVTPGTFQSVMRRHRVLNEQRDSLQRSHSTCGR